MKVDERKCMMAGEKEGETGESASGTCKEKRESDRLTSQFIRREETE